MVKTLFFILFYSVVGCSMTHSVNLQGENRSLPDNIKSGRFDSVDILCIPSSIESAMRINQENIDDGYFYKVSIQKIKASPYWSELIKSLNATEIKQIDDLKDLRCAVIFLKENIKVASIYYDENGKYGAINATPAIFKGGLYDWINDNFPKLID
ncbi:hypothetical protein LT02_004194 [Salmonella enterica]|nr:hypothetical protein [Salmonella enterica]ECK9682378.1 hypothetical protein [Salmonella enterica subsp. enterica serovar Washington]EDL5764102.1 hypothetical protein [Salmonella enterica subsp. enterica serovar Senftenberg]EDS3575974.1 hypothetical protein [Salmonella enterica subsp. enterica serovar Sangera]EDV0458629.1 hypothetical protein [Salmonella enterica subsp. enterica]EEE6745561.1 hypothetical protein [Salmonella enterica subsp. enterica serovar Westhampton]